MLYRLQDKLRYLENLVNTKFGSSGYSHASGRIDINEAGRGNISPNQGGHATSGSNRRSRVLNDLPPEILFQIFEELIWHISGNSNRTMRILSRVCRLWRYVALELRFCKIRVGSKKDVDTIADSIRASNRYKEKGTVAIREITVKLNSDWYACDVSELLRLSRSSLQNFYLAGDVTRGQPYKCPVLGDGSMVHGDFYFPELENLMLTGLTPVELISFLNYVNPAKLSSLFLCDIDITEFHANNETREKVESLHFPHLRELESMVDISTLSLFCQAAPSLETLYVHITTRAALGELVDLLASDRISKSFNMLKVDFGLGYWENATQASLDIGALLDLIRKRDWKKRIHLHNARESWIYA